MKPRTRSEAQSLRDKVSDLANSGSTYGQIAKEMGLTRCQVAGYVFRARHGTKRRPDIDDMQSAAGDA